MVTLAHLRPSATQSIDVAHRAVHVGIQDDPMLPSLEACDLCRTCFLQNISQLLSLALGRYVVSSVAG